MTAADLPPINGLDLLILISMTLLLVWEVRHVRALLRESRGGER
jgi:hypothetical protein